MNPKQAVIYLRRSTDRQEQSIDDQRDALRQHAREHGFEIVGEYCDDAVSGTSTAGRKAFQNLLADAQANGHEWRHVLVYDVKRFGRVDNDEAGHYRYLLRRAGVEVVYVAEGFNGDDSDDLLRPVKQWQAREESRSLSRVSIRGLVSLSEGGWWLGGAPPFGYDLLYHNSAGEPQQVVRFLEDGSKEILGLDGVFQRTLQRGETMTRSAKDHARLVPSAPQRVVVVRRMFDMYLAGLGYKTIAERLNAEGISSPRNGRWAGIHDGHWSLTSVRGILMNRIYAGDMVWNRRTAAKFHRIGQGRALARPAVAAGKWGANEEADWVIIPNAHMALVERETFERAQTLRAARDHKSHDGGFRGGRGKSSPYLLSGVIRCEACGHAFQGYTTTKGQPRVNGTKVKNFYYCCGGYVTKGNTVCKRVLFRQDALDDYVLREIGVRVNRFLADGGTALLRDIVAGMVANGPEDPRPEIARLRAHLKAIEEKADELVEMMTPANRDFVDQKLVKLRRERQTAELRLEDLARMEWRSPDVDGLVAVILDRLRDFPRVVAQGTPEERKTFVRAFVPEIRLHPHEARGTVRIRKLPLPAKASNGSCSFELVAGAGFEPATFGL